MRCAALSSPTSSQVARGLLKSFIFIIIPVLASSCEAQAPQDAEDPSTPFCVVDPAPVPATRLLSGRVPDPKPAVNLAHRKQRSQWQAERAQVVISP